MRILVACEFSGVVRRSFREKGHDAWSCDLLPAEDDQTYHLCGDVRRFLDLAPDDEPWDIMIAHPPCTRLANSGVRWLHIPPPGKTKEQMWKELGEACDFYLALRNCLVPLKAIENPVMHKYAREKLGMKPRHIIQPWWFGEPEFKATGFELHGLPPLTETNRLVPPAKGTLEHAAWSRVHRCSPGVNRWKDRSRTLAGVAMAMADQWGSISL
jgi:hypothetical protein